MVFNRFVFIVRGGWWFLGKYLFVLIKFSVIVFKLR